MTTVNIRLKAFLSVLMISVLSVSGYKVLSFVQVFCKALCDTLNFRFVAGSDVFTYPPVLLIGLNSLPASPEVYPCQWHFSPS